MYFYIFILLFLTVRSYDIDDSVGLGRTFDGIGGLSGGGATSKLLGNYTDPQRSEILDYLFKPNFGASLHILKVEIGGDSQSTEGTESSHMHNADDENYHRGYEWWLMKEAKARNPAIKLYGLSWAYPGWLDKGKSESPYRYPNLTANYIVKWIQGAKQVHSLDIDYIGIWNERNYDITYIETLRSVLDSNGLGTVKIVAADGNWDISQDVIAQPTFAKSFDIIGVHYPGTLTTANATKTNKQLWASEDYSTFNDNVGAGCWARILNQNYVNGYMTSTISWNLIASYYPNLPYSRCGLMTAMEPWSGHYVVESPIWITAHTTQFTTPGMKYLMHGSGVGHLDKGGSYVSFVDPQDPTKFTMVIETMSHNHSICIRPALPAYNVTEQMATFQLKGSLKTITSLCAWHTQLGFDGGESTMFQQVFNVKIDSSGSFSIPLKVDEVYTLTTSCNGKKGSYATPPASKPFPLPYVDNFTSYAEFSEAPLFVPQLGVWEVRNYTLPSHLPPHIKRPLHHVNRQVVTEQPINWCGVPSVPINMGGNYNWSEIYFEFVVSIPKNSTAEGAFIAVRVDQGGCDVGKAKGLFFWVYPKTQKYVFTNDLAANSVMLEGKTEMFAGEPMHMSLFVFNNHVVASLQQQTLFATPAPPTPTHGFVAYGLTNYGIADFDDVYIDSPDNLLNK